MSFLEKPEQKKWESFHLDAKQTGLTRRNRKNPVLVQVQKKFPTPETILTKKKSFFRSVGISERKTETILLLSKEFATGNITESKLKKMEDSEMIRFLCQYKGIGPWTAEMCLIFALDRWDHFSIGDLILRKGIENWYGISSNNWKEIESFVQRFSPFKTILSWYLWQHKDGDKGVW